MVRVLHPWLVSGLLIVAAGGPLTSLSRPTADVGASAGAGRAVPGPSSERGEADATLAGAASDGATVAGSGWSVPRDVSATVVAHWMGWFGSPNHRYPDPSYRSADPQAIRRQIADARALGIAGFTVDWYGAPCDEDGMPEGTPPDNCGDRAIIDEATRTLFEVAREFPGFRVAVVYDGGALSGLPIAAHAPWFVSDVNYARDHYLADPSYLILDGHAGLFIFRKQCADAPGECPSVADVNSLFATVEHLDLDLIVRDPDPEWARAPGVVGFFAWPDPGREGWDPSGANWGESYLTWFYNTMVDVTLPYSRMIAVGAVWPGFNDTLAPWRTWPARFMARREGGSWEKSTWEETWDLARGRSLSWVQIVSWNDWEEGTAIEPGESNGTRSGYVLDEMGEIGRWQIVPSTDGLTPTLAIRAGREDAGLELAWQVPAANAPTAGGAFGLRQHFRACQAVAPGDLLRFWYTGTTGVSAELSVGLAHNVSSWPWSVFLPVMLNRVPLTRAVVEDRASHAPTDPFAPTPGQTITWYSLGTVAHVPAWVPATLNLDASIWASDGICGVLLRIAPLDSAPQPPAGALRFDDLQILRVRSWEVPPGRERVSGDPERAAAAAAWIARQQVESGLVGSWAEESPRLAWLYDQALALLVLSWTDRPAAARLAERLAVLQADDGSWVDGYRLDGSGPLNDVRPWVGSVAWTVYALELHVAAGGDHRYLDNAREGAAWLAEQQRTFPDGRVHNSTEANLDAWWAFQVVGFYEEADRLHGYLMESAWNSAQGRWNRGYQDPGIALDAQTLGAAFATFVGAPERARAALAFARTTLGGTGFDGLVRGLDGAGPFGVWNEGTAQYIVERGPGAASCLDDLRRQASADGGMPGSPDDFTGGGVWLTPWHGIAPTAWSYFAETSGPLSGQ